MAASGPSGRSVSCVPSMEGSVPLVASLCFSARRAAS